MKKEMFQNKTFEMLKELAKDKKNKIQFITDGFYHEFDLLSTDTGETIFAVKFHEGTKTSKPRYDLIINGENVNLSTESIKELKKILNERYVGEKEVVKLVEDAKHQDNVLNYLGGFLSRK